MTESEFYQRDIKPLMNRLNIFCHRFESQGVPDVYMARNNISLWGELKCVIHKSKIVKPDWRVGQLAFVRRLQQYDFNMICLILNYCGETYFLPPKKLYKEEELVCQMKNYLKMMMLK